MLRNVPTRRTYTNLDRHDESNYSKEIIVLRKYSGSFISDITPPMTGSGTLSIRLLG